MSEIYSRWAIFNLSLKECIRNLHKKSLDKEVLLAVLCWYLKFVLFALQMN